MEFKRTNRNPRSNRRITVPERHANPLRPATASKHSPSPTHQSKTDNGGSLFGFEDLAEEIQNLDDVRFRDIISAWIKNSVRFHSPANKQKNAATFNRDKVTSWKNDLKWAMMSDLDEPVKPRTQQSHASTPSDSKTIDINISFGSLPKLSANKLSTAMNTAVAFVRRRSVRQRIIAGLVIIIAITLPFAPQLQRQWVIATGSNPDAVTSENITTQPNFKTMLPDGKSASDVNGKILRPPKSDPVYSYSDTLQNVKILVTQQPVPERLKPEVDDNVANLAKGFNATDKVTTDSLTVYIGMSVEGPQSVIFTKNDLLVLIKSDSKIDNDSWGKYARELK